MKLGQYIAALRFGKMTQNELARRCKMSRIMLAFFETGKRQVSLKVLLLMLKTLGVAEQTELTALSLYVREKTGKNYQVVKSR
jgi:transcriptional regulator with XRE-family HTH domain